MILITTALLIEAQLLIEEYGLKQILEKPFSIWKNDQLSLIVTGSGKSAAAAATSYLLTKYEDPSSVIANIGIVGHKDLPLSTPLLIHKVEDAHEKEVFYPTFLFDSFAYSQNLLSSEVAEEKYREGYCHDREGHAFYQTAQKFIKSERIHLLKIVAHHEPHSLEKASAESVISLLSSKRETLHLFLEKLAWLRDESSLLSKKKIHSTHYLNRFHFTVSERYKLEDILSKIDLLNMPLVDEAILNESKDAKEVLEKLKLKSKKTSHLF